MQTTRGYQQLYSNVYPITIMSKSIDDFRVRDWRVPGSGSWPELTSKAGLMDLVIRLCGARE